MTVLVTVVDWSRGSEFVLGGVTIFAIRVILISSRFALLVSPRIKKNQACLRSDIKFALKQTKDKL